MSEARPIAIYNDEPILVQLARLEGKLDRVNDRVLDIRSGVTGQQIDIDVLKSLTQTLQEGAAAAKETALALALALKDAKETQEATLRAETSKQNQATLQSEQSWVPYARIITIVIAVVAIATLAIQAKIFG